MWLKSACTAILPSSERRNTWLGHRDDEQRSIGHPAQSRRLIVDLDFGAQVAG
jgi:hypothetical protein